MPKTTHTIPHIELCLWYSEAIQGQETDSRRIVLYSLILSNPSIHPHPIFGPPGPKKINFKLAFSSLLKWWHLWGRPRPGETKKELSLRTGRVHSGALYYSRQVWLGCLW